MFAWRSLRRTPVFTLTVFTTLACGIATVTAVFSLVNTAVLRPLPYRDPDRLVALTQYRFSSGRLETIPYHVSLAVAQHLQPGRSFDRIGIYRTAFANHTIRISEDVAPARITEIDSDALAILGILPERGRLFTGSEVTAQSPVALISHRLWQSSFAALDATIGRVITLDRRPFTVIGIMPESFGFPGREDVWIPLQRLEDSIPAVDATDFGVIAHLANGVKRAGAQRELDGLMASLGKDDAAHFARGRLLVESQIVYRFENVRLVFVPLFMGAALAVLLVTCTNVASLMLIRASERRTHLAVRASLGASPSRNVQYMIVEALMLCSGAGALATLLAELGIKVLLASAPVQQFPAWMHLGFDIRVFLGVFLLVLLATLLIGIAPARSAWRLDLVDALKVGGTASSTSSATARIVRRSVVLQLAFSAVLAYQASLMIKSYYRATRTDFGYDPTALVGALVPAPQVSREDRFGRLTELAQLAMRVPGVASVALHGDVYSPTWLDSVGSINGPATMASKSAIGDDDVDLFPVRLGAPLHVRRLFPVFHRYAVSDNYFRTLGIRLVSGRTFGQGDQSGSPRVAVISERLAQLLWSRTSVVGEQLQTGRHGAIVTIVGVVADIRGFESQGHQRAVEREPLLYLSIHQVVINNPRLLVRTLAKPTAVIVPIERIIHKWNPESANSSVFSIAAQQKLETESLRAFGALLGVFAIASLALAGLGVYGVVGYGLACRRRDLGIRIAVGCPPGNAQRILISEGIRLAAVGGAVGFAVAIPAARLLSSLLVGVDPNDLATLLATGSVFAAIALLACYLPSRRIHSIDPVSVLRA